MDKDAGDAANDSGGSAKNADHGDGVAIELEASRNSLLSWTLFGTAFGALLVWKLGTVGVWAGYCLIAYGMFSALRLARTFMFAPGTIEVTDARVMLPTGLHRRAPLAVKPADVTAVYFLRRSVPWNHAAPVLVVEVGARALLYPRDWFASEADQRHVLHALLDRRPARD